MKVVKQKRITNLGKFIFIIAIICFSSGISFTVFQILSEKEKVIPKLVNPIVEEDQKIEREINLVMVGDALIHSSIYQDAKQADGSYDFKPMLEKIKPLVQEYDLKYYNQETILGGTELGLSNYPRFNSPCEVGDAFVDAGFNLVSLATNHTMDKGETGVLNSLNYWKQQESVYTAGSYDSFEERDRKVMKEINGIRYAFFSYTTWTNGLSTPSGKEYLNNVYSAELAKADIERVRNEVDVVIVAMHWGTEYSTGVSPAQEEIANYLASLGVDIIIGAHPHVVEPIEFIGKTMVIYSLGNFISDQVGTERLTGLMVSVTIHKTKENGITTISLGQPQAQLLYTHSVYGRKRNFKVYPYTELNETILPNYRTYYEKYRQIVCSRSDQIIMPSIGG